MVRHGEVWGGMVRRETVLCRVVGCGVRLCCVEWCGVVRNGGVELCGLLFGCAILCAAMQFGVAVAVAVAVCVL